MGRRKDGGGCGGDRMRVWEGPEGVGGGRGRYLQAWSVRSLSSLMVSSLRLRLPCRDLARDSAACTSMELSAALAARTEASKSST